MLRPPDRRDRDGAPRQLPLDNYARTRRRGLRDVAVAGAITVSDDALRRFLNRAVMGHGPIGLAQVGGSLDGQLCYFGEPPNLNFSSSRMRTEPSTARWNAWLDAC